MPNTAWKSVPEPRYGVTTKCQRVALAWGPGSSSKGTDLELKKGQRPDMWQTVRGHVGTGQHLASPWQRWQVCLGDRQGHRATCHMTQRLGNPQAGRGGGDTQKSEEALSDTGQTRRRLRLFRGRDRTEGVARTPFAKTRSEEEAW